MRSNQAQRSALGRIGEWGRVSKLRDSLLGLGRIAGFVIETSGRQLSPASLGRLNAVRADLASLNDYQGHLLGKVQFLLDATLGFINIDQNDIVKALTIASVVGIPPVLVAGIYGMNFKLMPEYGWTLGYPYALGLMLVTGLLPLIWFKWLDVRRHASHSNATWACVPFPLASGFPRAMHPFYPCLGGVTMRFLFLSLAVGLAWVPPAATTEKFAMPPTSRRSHHSSAWTTKPSRVACSSPVRLGASSPWASSCGSTSRKVSIVELATWIDDERRCCPFLDLAIEKEPQDGPLWLRLTGPEGVKEFLKAELGG